MNRISDCYTLNNGVSIPCVGFGTYKTVQEKDTSVLRLAIETGYRYFDTASFMEMKLNWVRLSGKAGFLAKTFFWPQRFGKQRWATKKQSLLFREAWNVWGLPIWISI